jgi:hypothetical protein
MPTVVLTLQGKTIPRNQSGDPCFTSLETVLTTFTPDEIVAMVNRYLYQFEYSKIAHRNRAQRQREQTAPLRKRVKEMFGVSWLRATEQQIQKATESLAKETKA